MLSEEIAHRQKGLVNNHMSNRFEKGGGKKKQLLKRSDDPSIIEKKKTQKRIRRIQNTLKDIKSLEKRKELNLDLNPEQLVKIGRKEALLKELEEMRAALEKMTVKL